MDFPGLAQYLVGLGPPGLIIGYLLWDRRTIIAEAQACRVAHMADIKKYSADITAALVTSAELVRVNNGIQEKAASSASLIAEAVREVSFRLKALEDEIKDLKP